MNNLEIFIYRNFPSILDEKIEKLIKEKETNFFGYVPLMKYYQKMNNLKYVRKHFLNI